MVRTSFDGSLYCLLLGKLDDLLFIPSFKYLDGVNLTRDLGNGRTDSICTIKVAGPS